MRRVTPIPARIRPGQGHSLRAKARGLPIGVFRGPPVKLTPARWERLLREGAAKFDEGGGVSPSTMVAGQATGTILRRVAN
jgi:hypothetical protein